MRAIPTVLALLVLGVGCGGAAKESAPATPSPEFAAPPGAYPGDSVPSSLQQFDSAERDVYAALGASPPGEPLAGPIGQPGSAQAPAAGSVAPAEPRAGGDPCATACTALASMRRSAIHLCELAGDDDGRCSSAKSRVETATAQVRARCPACGE